MNRGLKFIIPFSETDKSEEMMIIRRAISGLREVKTTATPTEQVDGMMANGGVSQVPTEEPIPQEAPNGPPSGVIGSQNASPEETVADDIPMEVPEGAFIINAAAAEVAGYGDIKKMILDAVGVARRLGVEISTGEDEAGDEEAVDLLVSKGEVYIEPTLAKIIGYDVLEKINNRGKREVARRQQEAEAKQQPSQEQPPQAPPQPQMAQEGGFVKKKFADGGDIIKLSELAQEYEQNLTSPIPTEQDLLKEIDPISDSATKQADIEFGFDMINRSNNDPVIRAAFQDSQRRLPSQFIEMRNMGVGEARQILSQKIIRDIRLKNPDRDFTSKPITPEELEGGRQINYYDDESILEAQLLGKKTLGKPDFDFLGQYSPTDTESPLGDRILTRAYGEEKDPIDVSATMFHELLHKGHQKLVGIPTSRVEKDSKGNLKYVRTTPAEKQRARLLHLDVHRRTYEAYKDELSPDSLKDFVEDVYSTYGSKATIAYMKRFIKNLIESEREEIVKKEGSAPIMFSGSFMSLTYLPDDRARPVADAVFAEVAKLPPIRALDEELKNAYQKQRNSQGFIPKK